MIKNWLTFLLAAMTFLACGQNANPSKNEKNKLTCILLGMDSLAYYYGDSTNAERAQQGHLSDATFMNKMITTAKEHATSDSSFVISVKPTMAGNVGEDFRSLVNLLNDKSLDHRSLDSLNEIEKKTFNTVSPYDIIHSEPVRLHLPKDEQNEDTLPNNPDRLVVLIYDEQGIYAYRGAVMTSGQKYSYAEFRALLQNQHSNGHFAVLIRPSGNCTYKNTVNMLDAMTLEKIKHYALASITAREETFLSQFISKSLPTPSSP
jgi:biopolymer transport protein ExbD